MAKKKIKPGEESTRKARQTALYQSLADDNKYFKICSLRRRSITYSLGGYTIRFEKDEEGRTFRSGGHNVYLADTNYTRLFDLTNMLFKAREAGDKEAQREKVEKKKAKKVSGPELELFSNLRVQLNPTKINNRIRKKQNGGQISGDSGTCD